MTIALALAGCTVGWAPPPPTSGPFPHPARYRDALRHGVDALEPGAPCAECHATADCARCHATYPHAPIAASTHAAPVDECSACHAAPSSDRVPRCGACHPSYPHPDGFELAGQHGVYALARGRIDLACGSCHGADLSGGVAEVACTKCHEDWPHPPGWDTGHESTAPDELARCGACHGADGSGGNSGVACGTCHAPLPHPDGWLAGGHASVAAVQGEADCLACHEPGDGSPAMLAPCGGTCHGGAR